PAGALKDDRWAVRSRALETLHEFTVAQARHVITLDAPTRTLLVDALTAVVGSDAPESERTKAARALGSARDRRAVEPLLAALGPTAAGRAAALALCELADPHDPRVFWGLFDVLAAGRWTTPLGSRDGGPDDLSLWLRRAAIASTVPQL